MARDSADVAVAWFDSPLCDRHDPGRGHPECPARLTAVRAAIAARRLPLRQVAATAIAPEDLRRIYGPDYVEPLRRACAQARAIDGDTQVGPGSWDAALHAAGAAVAAVHGVAAGHWQRAFCSVRPPGHHATASRAMGFCLFNGVALAARAAQAAGLQRVAIIDWDVHHGNGTQAIFYGDADVLFASTHRYPFYPGTGALEETGSGPGAGTTVNCPLPQGAGDAALWAAWETRIRPSLDAFGPDIVLVSAGFDADARDPLGGLQVSPGGFVRLSSAVRRWADSACGGRLVSYLEGGYDLQALGEDAALHVETLTG